MVEPSFAQPETMLSVIPASGEFWLNDQDEMVIEIYVMNVVELQGFDLVINFDPQVVHLEDWENGDMLSSLSIIKHVESQSSIQLAAVQLGGEPASGDGTLLRLIFSGVSSGVSDIMIYSSTLTHRSGDPIIHICENGNLTVGYFYQLTGAVSLQGRQACNGIQVALGEGAAFGVGPYITESQENCDMNLDFGPVVADAYTITTSQPRYLNITPVLNKEILLLDAPYSLSPLTLRAGNAVWADNVIDAADASLVGASYGRTVDDLEPGETLDADVNFDGVVNLRDLALVAGNYGLTSAAAYESWQP